MILSCNNKMLWKLYDKKYIFDIGNLIFKIDQQALKMWTKYEPNQINIQSQIEQEMQHVALMLKPEQTMKNITCTQALVKFQSVSSNTQLILAIKTMYDKIQNLVDLET